MIFAVRHGQRADDPLVAQESTKIQLDYDPPLSKHGVAQAYMTGKYMRDFISAIERKTGEPQKIVLLSSPFLRCIQTALALANGLDYFHKNTLYITNEISEIQKTKFFSKDVLPDLLFRKNVSNEIDTNYFETSNGKTVTIKEKHFFKSSTSTNFFTRNEPVFPETITDCSMRFKKAKKHIKQKYFSKNVAANTVVILVTHSIGVQCMIHEMEPEKEIPQIDYCSLTQITYKFDIMRKEAAEKIEMKNFNEHIKIKVREEKQ